MNSEVAQLKEKINGIRAPTEELVNALNRLALIQLEGNITDAYEISQRAVMEARLIKYTAGEALALLHAGMCASAQRNYNEAQDYYLQSLHLREKLDDNEGIATVCQRLGTLNLYEGRYNDALEYYDRAIVIRAAAGDDLGVADLYSNSGIIHGFQGNHTLALKCHMMALSTFEVLNESSRIASSCTNIGILYKEQKNYDEALKMFKQALEIRQKGADTKAISYQLNNIGNVYQEQGRFQEALDMHQQALQLREQSNDFASIATSYSNLGNVYRSLHNYDLAMQFYTQALAYFKELNNKRGLVQSYINLGELYFDLRDEDKALHYLVDAIKLAEELGLKNQLRQALLYVTEIYEKQRRYEEAFAFYKRYTTIDKEISNIETSKQIAQMTLRHELEQKERAAIIEREKNAELTKAYNSLEAEKQRSEELLNNILPEEVSEELKSFGKTRARSFEMVTVLFADIQNFTRISEQLSAEDLVSGIDEYFEAFDKIVEANGVEKIKTIGDAYLCAGGVPVPVQDHALRVVTVAKQFLKEINNLNLERERVGKQTFIFRVGIHSGPLVAGVVGIKKFAYDIWGDTVNTASRMQQNSLPGQINISESTYQLVKDYYPCSYRGELEVKNKGKLHMYFVD